MDIFSLYGRDPGKLNNPKMAQATTLDTISSERQKKNVRGGGELVMGAQ